MITGCYIGTTTFSGQILDAENQKPIENAQLLFVERVTYTDEKGTFFFDSVPYGLHTLFIEVPFYKDEQKIIDISNPHFSLSAPILLSPFHWIDKNNYYLYKDGDNAELYASLDGVNFSEEKLLPWGEDLTEKWQSLTGSNCIIPYKVYTAWQEDNVNFENVMAFTIYSDSSIHVLKRAISIKNEDLQREIFAHEFTHLFIYKFSGVKEPYIQEGLAFYFPSFVFGYGKKYDYIYYKKRLLKYLNPKDIPKWKRAGEIYSHPEDTKIFWFSVYELRSIFFFLANKYGQDKVIEFVLKLKKIKDDYGDLFLEVFEKDVETLQKEWRDYFSLWGDIKRERENFKKPYIY